MMIRVKEVTYDSGTKVFTVQEKLFGLFWVDSKQKLHYSDYCGGAYYNHFNVFFEKKDAEKYAQELKKFYTKEKEPKIINKTYTEI